MLEPWYDYRLWATPVIAEHRKGDAVLRTRDTSGGPESCRPTDLEGYPEGAPPYCY